MNGYDRDLAYDWDFGFGFGRRYRAHPGGRGYSRDYRGRYDRELGPGSGRWLGQGGWRSRAIGGRGAYDRGLYGGDYPTFGGYPGAPREGMYYGRGGAGGWASRPWRSGPGSTREYDERLGSGRGGYDAGFAHEPFLPEAAYRRHPELERPPHRGGDRWSAPGRPSHVPVHRSDEEIEHAVRENLYRDSWVDAERIEASVEDGVVTLSGEVGDYLEARYAWDDAWEVEGVRGVINQITVRTDLPTESAAMPQTASGSEE